MDTTGWILAYRVTNMEINPHPHPQKTQPFCHSYDSPIWAPKLSFDLQFLASGIDYLLSISIKSICLLGSRNSLAVLQFHIFSLSYLIFEEPAPKHVLCELFLISFLSPCLAEVDLTSLISMFPLYSVQTCIVC